MTSSSVSDLIEQLNHINDIISDVVVYHKEVILLRGWILSVAQSLEDSNFVLNQQLLYDDSNPITTIANQLTVLSKTIQMLTEGIWLGTAASWPADSPTKDFLNITRTINNCLAELHIQQVPYSPTPQDYIDDYHLIYSVLHPLSRNNPDAKLRLAEIDNFLAAHNLPKASSTLDNKIADIFQSIKEYQVKREDYRICRQIGWGATGTVHLGQNVHTQEYVAIKQLHATDLVEYEIESLRRELAILSSLHHPYLIEFIGATSTSPYWIITKYCEKGSLHTCLQNNVLQPNDITKIAYQMASGIAYLHSKNIIHRDLKTGNILVSNENEARVTDFGISRKVDTTMTGKIGTYNYMAPEVIAESRYSLKADTFSFGMMLWEMVTRTPPFASMNEITICRNICDNNRPPIPKSVSPELKALITSCWAQDPNVRPSFTQIMEAMRRKNITFPGADPTEMKNFYKAQRALEHDDIVTTTSRRTSLMNIQNLENASSDTTIMKLLTTNPKSPKLIELLNKEVISGKNKSVIGKLQKSSFIEKILENIDQIADITIACYALCFTITDKTISNFINAGGIDLIIRWIVTQEETKIQAAKILVNHISAAISTEQTIPLLDTCLSAHMYDISALLINGKKLTAFIDIIGKYKFDLLSGDFKKERALLLGIYVLHAGFSSELAAKIDANFVLENESVDLAQKISQIPAFVENIKQQDVISIIKTISVQNYSQERRAAAIVLATILPATVLKLVATKPKFIDDVISVSNIDVVGKLLFKLCQFSECASYVLDQTSFLRMNIKTPAIFALFIRLASFYPARVLTDDFIMKHIISLLQNKSPKLPEVCLRICGILSSSNSFLPYAEEIVNIIFGLIKNGALTKIELTLAIGVLYNISALKKFTKLPHHIMSLAENDSPIAGMVLRVAARCNLPKSSSSISGRFVDLFNHFIAGHDKYARLASCEILLNVVGDSNYKQAIENSSVPTKLNQAMQTEKQPEVFVQLANVSNAYSFPVSTEAVNSCDSILTQLPIDHELVDTLRGLRSKLSKRVGT